MKGRRLALGSLALSALSTLAAAQEVPSGAVDPFVHVDGARFVSEGARLRFVGANVAVMHGRAHRDALETTLDAVQADGLSVIRVWALGEREDGAPEWTRDYAFRVGEAGWIDESFAHLDHVLDAARARGLRVIVVLANRWADYGGVPQYLRWVGAPFDADAPEGVARTELGAFFRSEAATAQYLAHVERVVSRTSARTGVPYRDDPAIFAWELFNEISAERRDAADLEALLSRAASRVHALDPHHLVSAGHVGYVRASERRTWLEVSRLPGIDFADAHAYPAEYDRVRDLGELDRFVDDHVALAHGLAHRPLVFGEMGFRVRQRSLGRSRAALFDRFLTHAGEAGVDGVLAWSYAPSADPAGSHTILADHADADSRRVRAVLADHAHTLASHIVEGATEPTVDVATRLWDPTRVLRGTGHTGRADRTGTITLRPRDFTTLRFEAGGRWPAPVPHVYGSGFGYVEFRFTAPRRLGAVLRLSMRASSELPGQGQGARPDDGSRVRVAIDDVPLGTIDVPPDDGVGRVVTLEAPIDEALRAALVRPGTHVLRFSVDDDDEARGLCLYESTAELEGLLRLSFPREPTVPP